MQKKIDERSTIHRTWLMIVLPVVCVILLTTGIFALPNFNLFSRNSSSRSTTSLLTDSRISFSKTVIHEETPIQALAHTYMTALLKGQYNTMWSLLNPQIQAKWPGKVAYAALWQARFHDYILQSFTIGNVKQLASWVDPETMKTYSHVEEMPVSLELRPDQTLLQKGQLGQLPPEDVHPDQVLKNLPFIVQQAAPSPSMKSHWQVLVGGPADPEAPILPPLKPLFTIVPVPILMYHYVDDVVPPTALGMSLTVTPTQLKQQLDYLQQQGFHTITFNQLFDALYFGAPLPAHPIILTFDDGYSDTYQFALPLLKQFGFSAMFYIITGKVGWQGYMNWGNIRDLLANGMQIGSHTVHHVDMGNMLQYSLQLAQHELQASKARLEKQLGRMIQQFCYPSGEPFRSESRYLQLQIVALLATDGYIGATTDPGLSGIDQNSQAPFALLRIRVDGRETFNQFTWSLP